MAESKLDGFIKNPRRSLISVSIPVIAAAVVETLYNLVDTFFVGKLGPEALAAITFSWPFFFILVAISLGINSGISSRIARFLGEKNKSQAENTALHGLVLALISSLAIAIVSIPFLDTIFKLSGASGEVMKMASSYMFIILLGVVFMFLSYAINSIFSAQGDTKTAMKIDIYSLALNIILAPIFIFVLGMGIKGAALATSVAVLFAFIQSIYYLSKVSYLRLNFRSFRFSSEILKDITKVGFPSTLMMLVMSFYIIFLNKAMAHFSVNHVAAFGVVSRLESVAILPIYGLSIGAMTLAGMFYGAKAYNLLKDVSWYAVRISIIIASVIGIVFFIFPQFFISIFTADAEVIKIGIPYMMLDVFTFPAMAITMITSRILQGFGYGMPGLVINVVRVFVIAVPLSYFFVFMMGYEYLSIAIAMILGGLIATVLSIYWLNKHLRQSF